jgi:hypothetical protein
MKKLMLAVILMGAFSSAYAMTYFLVAQWFEGGSQMCKYGNGSVLNMGANICPLQIDG